MLVYVLQIITYLSFEELTIYFRHLETFEYCTGVECPKYSLLFLPYQLFDKLLSSSILLMFTSFIFLTFNNADFAIELKLILDCKDALWLMRFA